MKLTSGFRQDVGSSGFIGPGIGVEVGVYHGKKGHYFNGPTKVGVPKTHTIKE